MSLIGDSTNGLEARRLRVGVMAADGDSRRRLSSWLRAGGVLVVAEADHPAALSSADCAVIVAHSAEGTNAAGLVRSLVEGKAGVSVVLVIERPSARHVRRAIDAGASGIVDHEGPSGALAATVLAVCAGQVAVPRKAGRQTQDPVLSSREKQVLGMVVLGFTNAEIAARLYLAESTVKSHLSSAFHKLGVGSRNEAAALILDPDSNLGPGILAISPPSGRLSTRIDDGDGARERVTE